VFWPARSPAYPPQPGGRATQDQQDVPGRCLALESRGMSVGRADFHSPTAAARPPDLPPRAAAVLLEWGGAQELAARAPSHPETAHYIRAAARLSYARPPDRPLLA